MTIDERLEKLTERHEALAQTVELLAAENRQMAAENKERDRRLGEIMEGVARLLHIAEIHEQRIERLEEGQR
jgi:archaellum component FlaC